MYTLSVLSNRFSFRPDNLNWSIREIVLSECGGRCGDYFHQTFKGGRGVETSVTSLHITVLPVENADRCMSECVTDQMYGLCRIMG